jgi:hypothetical protein
VLEKAVHTNHATEERRLEAHALAALGDSLMRCHRPTDARCAFEQSGALRPLLGDRLGEGVDAGATGPRSPCGRDVGPRPWRLRTGRARSPLKLGDPLLSAAVEAL